MKQKYISMLLIKGTSAAILFAGSVLPTWCLTTDQFGTFSYLTSLLLVLSCVVIWGTERYCIKNVALNRDEKGGSANDDKAAESVEALETESAIFGSYAIVAINTILFAIALLWWLPGKLAADYSVTIGAIAVLIMFSRSIAQLSCWITKGLDRVITSEIVISLIRPLVFVIPLALVYFTSTPISLSQVLLLFAASFLVAAGISLFINQRSGLASPAVDPKSIPKLYQLSFLFLLVSVGLPLMSNINTIQLGNMAEPLQASSAQGEIEVTDLNRSYLQRPKTEIALFSIAAKLVSLVLLALVSANLLIAPKLSPLFYGGKIDAMRKLIRSNNMFIAALTVAPIALFVFFAEPILSICGPEYVAAAGMLQTLMLGQAVSVFCGPVVLTSTMVGMQRAAALIILCACAANWLLCLWLIPQFGGMGAVYASVFSNIVLNAALAVNIYQRIGLNVTMLNLIR